MQFVRNAMRKITLFSAVHKPAVPCAIFKTAPVPAFILDCYKRSKMTFLGAIRKMVAADKISIANNARFVGSRLGHAALLLIAFSTLTYGQAVQQSGSVTPSHPTRWITTGVVGDGGTPTNPLLTGVGTYGSGPTICANSALPSSGNYNRLCITATATGGGFTMNNFGTATGGYTFTLNGVTQGLATVTLPVTAGDAACFADSTGTLNDCGGVPVIVTCATAGAVPVKGASVWGCSTTANNGIIQNGVLAVSQSVVNPDGGLFSVGTSAGTLTQGRAYWVFNPSGTLINSKWFGTNLGGLAAPYLVAPSSDGVLASFTSYVQGRTTLASTGVLFDHNLVLGNGRGGSAIFARAIMSNSYTPDGSQPGVVGVQGLGQSSVGGSTWGGYFQCTTLTTNPTTECIGIEANTDAQIATTQKVGIQIVDISTSVGAISGESAAFKIAATGGIGYKDIFLVGAATDAQSPFFSTTANLLKTRVTSTIDTGFNIASLVVTNCTYQSLSYCVSGGAGVAASAGIISSSGGADAASPSPRITLGSYADNAGAVSISHIALYSTTFGFGISAAQLNYITASGSTHNFYTGADLSKSIASVGTNGVTLAGATSGTTNFRAAATAGTTTITFPGGTTDFSATGGTSQVVKQVSAGAAFTVARLACADLSDALSGCSAASGITALTGDVTATGPGSVAATLATVNANVGTFGSATQSVQFTVNAKGLMTAAANVTVTPAVGSITGLGTGVATALAVSVGSAGAFVTFNGALGSPSSVGTLPAHTLGGTISGGGNQINNVIIGTSTPLSAAFTTLTAETVQITNAVTNILRGTWTGSDASAETIFEMKSNSNFRAYMRANGEIAFPAISGVGGATKYVCISTAGVLSAAASC